MLRDRLVEAGEITLDDYKQMDTEILEEIENDVIKYAEESPEPSMELLDKYVLAENDPWVKGGTQ
jgi:pyruvate dehydrogenase E1 component alpha subunit